MSMLFSHSLAAACASLLSSCFISAALTASQVVRLFDCLVVQTFNSKNRENFTRRGAEKSASLEKLALRDLINFDPCRGRGSNNSIEPNRGEVRLSQWLAQPRAGKPFNFPALLRLLQNAEDFITKSGNSSSFHSRNWLHTILRKWLKLKSRS